MPVLTFGIAFGFLTANCETLKLKTASAKIFEYGNEIFTVNLFLGAPTLLVVHCGVALPAGNVVD